MKGRCCELFNFLSQLSKAQKGKKRNKRKLKGASHFPDVAQAVQLAQAIFFYSLLTIT
jgi:hypothetical protein